jgi:hypothetical protein
MFDDGPLIELGAVDPVLLADVHIWLAQIPLTEWPQQNRIDESIRPAMVNDLAWHDFGTRTDRLIASVAKTFHGRTTNRMLSVVMPGHSIDLHRDRQEPAWLGRVHIPIATNDEATFRIGEEQPRVLQVGMAYSVDVREPHSIENRGATPRVHLMFDVVTR